MEYSALPSYDVESGLPRQGLTVGQIRSSLNERKQNYQLPDNLKKQGKYCGNTIFAIGLLATAALFGLGSSLGILYRNGDKENPTLLAGSMIAIITGLCCGLLSTIGRVFAEHIIASGYDCQAKLYSSDAAILNELLDHLESETEELASSKLIFNCQDYLEKDYQYLSYRQIKALKQESLALDQWSWFINLVEKKAFSASQIIIWRNLLRFNDLSLTQKEVIEMLEDPYLQNYFYENPEFLDDFIQSIPLDIYENIIPKLAETIEQFKQLGNDLREYDFEVLVKTVDRIYRGESITSIIMECRTTTDVVFLVKGNRIFANRQLLSDQSPVFAKLFQGPFKETSSKEIPIDDISYQAFKLFVDFLDHGKKGPVEYNLIEELAYLGDKYDVPDFITYCSNLLDHSQHHFTFIKLQQMVEDYHLHGNIKVQVDRRLASEWNDFVDLKENPEHFIENWNRAQQYQYTECLRVLAKELNKRIDFSLDSFQTLYDTAIFLYSTLQKLQNAESYTYEALKSRMFHFMKTHEGFLEFCWNQDNPWIKNLCIAFSQNKAHHEILYCRQNWTLPPKTLIATPTSFRPCMSAPDTTGASTARVIPCRDAAGSRCCVHAGSK